MNNPTIFQFFHWNYPADGSLWNHVAEEAPRLEKCGITHVWLPPAYKDAGGKDIPQAKVGQTVPEGGTTGMSR